MNEVRNGEVYPMNLREYRDFCVKMMVGYAALGGMLLGMCWEACFDECGFAGCVFAVGY